MHWAVDSAVAFLVVVLPLLFLEVSIWVVIVIAVVLGWLLAPWSRRAEIRALAAREAQARGEDPPAGA